MRGFKVAQALICSLDNFTCILENLCFPGCCKLGDCEACSGLKPVSDLHNKSVLLISAGLPLIQVATSKWNN